MYATNVNVKPRPCAESSIAQLNTNYLRQWKNNKKI